MNLLLAVIRDNTCLLHHYCQNRASRDSGVGKTGLGWRLAHGEFKEHPSTHGQQFWMNR